MNRNNIRRRLTLVGLTILTATCAVPTYGAQIKVVTPPELWALFDRKAMPLYPYEARRARMTGAGLFRMYIDADGRVRAVGVMKSTGSKILDLSAAGGLYRWHAIPGKRREVDMPVRFTLTR